MRADKQTTQQDPTRSFCLTDVYRMLSILSLVQKEAMLWRLCMMVKPNMHLPLHPTKLHLLLTSLLLLLLLQLEPLRLSPAPAPATAYKPAPAPAYKPAPAPAYKPVQAYKPQPSPYKAFPKLQQATSYKSRIVFTKAAALKEAPEAAVEEERSPKALSAGNPINNVIPDVDLEKVSFKDLLLYYTTF